MGEPTEITIYTDGASRGGSGHAASAWIILDASGMELERTPAYLGRGPTNNVAEYKAVIGALEAGLKHCRMKAMVFSDSELVVKQVNTKDEGGGSKTKAAHLILLRDRVRELSRSYAQGVSLESVSRDNEWIRQVDDLCNACLDEHDNGLEEMVLGEYHEASPPDANGKQVCRRCGHTLVGPGGDISIPEGESCYQEITRVGGEVRRRRWLPVTEEIETLYVPCGWTSDIDG